MTEEKLVIINFIIFLGSMFVVSPRFIILLLVLELFDLLLSKGKQNRQAALHTSQTSCFLAVFASVAHNLNLIQPQNRETIR